MKTEFSWGFFALWSVLLLVSDTVTLLAAATVITVHEAGHFAAMRLLGITPRRLCFAASGMNIEYDDKRTSYGTDIAVALAGSAGNLLLFSASFLFPTGYYTDAVRVFSLALAAFNLLPVPALDGGRAVCAAVSYFFGVDRAERTVKITGVVTGFLLFLAGIALYFVSGGNFTLLLAAIWLFSVVNGGK